MEQLLRCLSRRLRQSEGFPHEIGVFLGYPLEDVIGFCRHKGEGCKLCGYWKVYGDVDHAKRCFAAFDCCRDAPYARLLSGSPETAGVRSRICCLNDFLETIFFTGGFVDESNLL